MFVPASIRSLLPAIPLAEAKRKEGQAKEEKIFSEFGVKVAGTSITAGAAAALAKLRQLKESCVTFFGHEVVPPSAAALGDLFADETAKVAAEEAAAKDGIKLGPARLLAEAA
jgi:hypothetical protein